MRKKLLPLHDNVIHTFFQHSTIYFGGEIFPQTTSNQIWHHRIIILKMPTFLRCLKFLWKYSFIPDVSWNLYNVGGSHMDWRKYFADYRILISWCTCLVQLLITPDCVLFYQFTYIAIKNSKDWKKEANTRPHII